MRASSAPYFLFSPSDFSLGAVAEMRRMFQAACPAFHQPALRPTRGSGVGAVPETIGSAGFGIDFGGIGGGGGGGGRGWAPSPRRSARRASASISEESVAVAAACRAHPHVRPWLVRRPPQAGPLRADPLRADPLRADPL